MRILAFIHSVQVGAGKKSRSKGKKRSRLDTDGEDVEDEGAEGNADGEIRTNLSHVVAEFLRLKVNLWPLRLHVAFRSQRLAVCLLLPVYSLRKGFTSRSCSISMTEFFQK